MARRAPAPGTAKSLSRTVTRSLPVGTPAPLWVSVIDAAGGAPLSLAGLWERWERGSEPLETFTILTTAASSGFHAIHHRQPSIVDPEDFDEWLAADSPQDRLLALARRSHEGPFEHWAVSPRVNNARNDAPELLLALEE